MEHETPQLSRAMPSVEAQAARFAAFSAPTPSGLAIELRELRARLRSAHEHAAATLTNAGLPGCRPGEALKRFLAADAEIAAIVRRIKEIQAFTKGWRDRPRRSAGQVS
jgi:hypothetical protein